ncbi:LLM class flavin-dependent oxidoreductase [Microbacterium gorillae]|uniref:LLM class flavin-dependent oxidoreductase n=1 Tax=Microbacterium gorillae TaxID=1231063 RepID=UPI00058F6C20|nr:LLM class flavin-dependent oxidoreductase [Microbacterium gorillae]
MNENGQTLELGVQTFGDVRVLPDHEHTSDGEVLREIVDHARLADHLGMDVFGVGEHHRPDFPVSAPDVVLAAIAAVTEDIHLTSSVSVLSTDDPVRLYERFATLDGLSAGRAEVILGRGSFTESFPLFGFELADYDRLFAEKLELWAQLRAEAETSWSGTTRPPLDAQRVFPRSDTAGGLATWVGVGGNPQSVVRVAHHEFDLMMAGLGMDVPRLQQYFELFRRASEQFGTSAGRIGLSTRVHIADTDAQARDELWPSHLERNTRIGAERGWAPPSRESFEQSVDHGLELVGSVDTVTRRITETVSALGLDRLILSYDGSLLTREQKERTLTLLGEEVFPRVRAAVAADRTSVAA